MTTALLLIVAVAPIVVDAIERARCKAGLSHKELALAQGISAKQWSQQMHGLGHVALDRLSATPDAFRAALLEELRAEWHLTAPTLSDIYALLLALVRPRMARAGLDRASDRHQEDICAG